MGSAGSAGHSVSKANSVSKPADAAGSDDVETIVNRMGVAAGNVVQELGYAEDTDDALVETIESVTGGEVVDAESDEIVDIVLQWFREGDADLVDALVDAIGALADDGVIWLLTPKRGRSGHVDPSDIAEAAPLAGLSVTSQMPVAPDWSGTRLASRRSRTERR